MKKTESHPIKTSGIVNPTDWDDNGNIIEIGLALPGEIDYIIELNRIGKKLVRYINKEIRIYGHLFKDKIGRDIIRVVDYEENKLNQN